MEITKLQYIANQVALDSVSSNRQLRNEEIRQRMYGDWSPPTETAKQPTTIQNTSKNYEGGDSTLASTYSKLLNNYNTITGDYNSPSSSNSSVGGYSGQSLSIPSWAPLAVSTVMTLGGYGGYAPFASTAMKLMRGDRAGATGTMASYLTNKLTEGKIPGLGGLVGTLASGIIGDRSTEEIGQGVANAGLGSLVSMANPVAGIAYNLLRGVGFNPAYGLNNLFGNGLQGVAPGYEGTLGGFFGNNAIGDGIESTQSNIGNAGYVSSGSGSGYVPNGYESSDLGGGITPSRSDSPFGGYGNGISGSLSSPYSSDSSDGYSYSNPAGSYGGWSPSSSSSDSGGD